MIPMYLPSAASTSELLNGVGQEISNCRSCVVTQGAWECNCTIVAGAENNISSGYILAKTRNDLEPQIFVITHLTKALNQITINAEHIKISLNDLPIITLNSGKMLVRNAINELILSVINLYPPGFNFPFKYDSDESLGDTVEYEFPWDKNNYHSFAEILSSENELSITSITGGGYFDFDNFKFRFIGQSCIETMAEPLELGKNITGVDYTIDYSNVYNCAFPYYYRTNSESQSEICFSGHPNPAWWKNGNRTWGDGAYSYISSKSIYNFSNFNPLHIKAYPINFAEIYPSLTTSPAVSSTYLERDCNEWVTKNEYHLSTPTITINVNVVDLAKSKEFENLQNFKGLHVGKKIRIIIPALGVNNTLQVTDTTYDSICERFTAMTLSSAQKNISDTIIAQERRQKKTNEIMSAMPTLIPTMIQAEIKGE